MVRSFYKLPEKNIKMSVACLIEDGTLSETENGYILSEDLTFLTNYTAVPPKSVYAMHRNDFLVKSNEHWLKEKYTHSYSDTLYYMLIDGEFRGAVVGKFRYTPEVEDIILDISREEAKERKESILQAVRCLCGNNNKIKRYRGDGVLFCDTE
jgi:hypothetical protein